MKISKQEYKKINDELYDDGLMYCESCESYFIVRATSDINSRVCPVCGVVSDDNIHGVDIEDDYFSKYMNPPIDQLDN